MIGSHPNRAHHAWQSLRQTFPVRKSEWTCAFVMFAVSLVLAFNPTLFTQFKGYDGMARFAPQWAWQWVLFAIGAGRLAALTVNGAYWRTPHFRAAFAFLACFGWWQITAGFVANFGMSFILAGGWLVQDAFNFKQALIEAFASEALREAERRNDAASQH